MNKLLLPFLLLLSVWSCSRGNSTEKHQKKRDRIVDVRDKLREIESDELLVGKYAQVCVAGKYLVIEDMQPYDKIIHIIDKNTYQYLGSAGDVGQGPGEIALPGCVAPDEVHRKLYITDHGKLRVFSFDIDSALADPSYLPPTKLKINNTLFPSEYEYISDTLCIGRVIRPIGNNDFAPLVGVWNMQTGEIRTMPYTHPAIEKKRMLCAASPKLGLYVECYSYNDLMTIGGLDGSLKCNVYGPQWGDLRSNRTAYYGKPLFVGDNIIVSFSGGDNFDPKVGDDKFLVFTSEGDYLRTLEVGSIVRDFCYDAENNRLILSLDGDMQFASLPLDGLMEENKR